MEYEAVIGLETHVQLKTKSKMWCGCANQYGSEPNTNVCPVCLGLPGVLPVPNEEALRKTVLTGFLLNCEIPRYAKFDRKNYFYPDASKNYQLTQYDKPSTANGFVEFELNGGISRVRITRAHLEEDVGKLTHFDRTSGVDFNRAGVPLLEIVSEPDITSADMAYAYLNALTDILHQGGVSDCDMEKGMVRCDVNISVRPVGAKELGAKIEIKNMNSFSGVRRAVEYEIPRQIEALKRGEKLIQSTRRWDDVAGITEQMRTKEDAHDYRYFPCPDLVPVRTAPILERVKPLVPELPHEKCARFEKDFGLSAYDSSVLASEQALAAYFEEAVKAAPGVPAKKIANWVINELLARLNEVEHGIAESPLKPESLGELVAVVEAGKISNNQGKEVFGEMFATGGKASDIIKAKGFEQVSDTGALEGMVDQIIAANPDRVAEVKSGNEKAMNWFTGQVMKLSGGKANPKIVTEIVKAKVLG